MVIALLVYIIIVLFDFKAVKNLHSKSYMGVYLVMLALGLGLLIIVVGFPYTKRVLELAFSM